GAEHGGGGVGHPRRRHGGRDGQLHEVADSRAGRHGDAGAGQRERLERAEALSVTARRYRNRKRFHSRSRVSRLRAVAHKGGSMASTPIGSVQGLASNIQWQDLVDQIVAQDSARTLTPVTNRISTDKSRAAAWS